MATRLNEYQSRKAALEQGLAQNGMDLNQSMQYQELVYRIGVLETCRMLSKTAPLSTETKTLIRHYHLVDAYMQCLMSERRFGMPADEKRKACRKTAADALEKTVTDCRKRFSCFKPADQSQYKQSVSTMINTILPAWLQYRNTCTQIDE